MLLNEFFKEHRKVQELEATVAQQRNNFEVTICELKTQIATVVARSEDQDEKIQKVSAQLAAANPSRDVLQVSKSASRTAGRICRGAPAQHVVVRAP
jgi:hypothetical protein